MAFGLEKQLPRLNIADANYMAVKARRQPALFLHLQFEQCFSLILDTKNQRGGGRGGEEWPALMCNNMEPTGVAWLKCQAGSEKTSLKQAAEI